MGIKPNPRRLSILVALVAVFIIFLSLTLNSPNASAHEKPKNSTPTKALVTFVEIGSVNCIPCQAMQPILKAVAEEYGGQVKVVFYDVWTPQGKADAAGYDFRVIPTQIFLDKNGKEYFRHEGYYPKSDVVRALNMQGVK